MTDQVFAIEAQPLFLKGLLSVLPHASSWRQQDTSHSCYPTCYDTANVPALTQSPTCLFVPWVLSFLINVAPIIKHLLCFSIAFSLLVDPHQPPLIPLPATTSFLFPDSQQNFFGRVVYRQGLSVCISAALFSSPHSNRLTSSVTAFVKVTNDLHLAKSNRHSLGSQQHLFDAVKQPLF